MRQSEQVGGDVRDMTAAAPARYPYAAPIDSYGNGGFRFAGMSHKGSILALPSGIHAWSISSAEALTGPDFETVLADAGRLEFVLLGTGAGLVVPSAEVRARFAAAGVGLEPMSTGAAARTYNILLGERRAVGAALIAVE